MESYMCSSTLFVQFVIFEIRLTLGVQISSMPIKIKLRTSFNYFTSPFIPATLTNSCNYSFCTMASMQVLVEWIGDENLPDCWKIIRRDDFLKPEKLKEGEVLDAYWKQGEETSPAKVLKISAISEKARFYGLVPPKKIKGCCEHCTQLRERVKELEADVLKLSKKIRFVSRSSSGLAEKIEGLQTESEEANPEAELEKSCRQLTSNSTSLYVTVKMLLRRLFTDEEILSHSVSGKASNSKVVAKPRFDPMKIGLIRKIASELHGSQIVNTSTVTHKIQAVQKAVKRELEGNSGKLGK